MNLSSLGSFSSLASTALDTTRSTFKSLAEAAVAADDSGAAKSPDQPKPAATTVPAGAAAEATTKGGRFGRLLDAYA
jgi:hypothetical protein